MIPLPASKLPYLIAATSQPSSSSQQPASASPFSVPPAFSMGAASEASSQSMPASPSGMMLPPRRQGPPPPLADVPNRESSIPQLSLPSQPNSGAPAFPMSPFAAVGSQMHAAGITTATQPLTATPFAPAQADTPFGQVAGPAPQTPTLPQGPQAAPTASPFGQASAPSPSATPFMQAAPTISTYLLDPAPPL